MTDSTHQTIPDQVLDLFRCPLTRSKLRQDGDCLVAEIPPGAGLRYPIRDGIPVLLIDQAQLPEGVDSLAAFKTKYADAVVSG